MVVGNEASLLCWLSPCGV